jgi:dienelactone hydrolase
MRTVDLDVGETQQVMMESARKTSVKLVSLNETRDGLRYDPVIYPGAGHGFMRAGEDPQGMEANRKARTAAWERLKGLLKKV